MRRKRRQAVWEGRAPPSKPQSILATADALTSLWRTETSTDTTMFNTKAVSFITAYGTSASAMTARSAETPVWPTKEQNIAPRNKPEIEGR
jgi:hypothetical protein